MGRKANTQNTMVTISNPLEFIMFSLLSVFAMGTFAVMGVLSAIVFIPEFSNTIYGSIMMVVFALVGIGGLYLWLRWFIKGFKNLQRIREEEEREKMIKNND